MNTISNSTGNSNILYTDPKTGRSIYGLDYDGPSGFEMLLQLTKTPPESLLYNGAKERSYPTREETAALAKKYDPTNMTQKEYESFLDELQGMGVISEMEKMQMGYIKGVCPLGYIDADGDYVWSQSSGYSLGADASADAKNLMHHCIGLGDDGNLKRRLDAIGEWTICRSTCSDPDTQRVVNKSVKQEKERLSLITGIVNNILEYRKQHHLPISGNTEAAKDSEKDSDLLEQASAPGGAFWLDLRNVIMENARKKRLQEEEEKTFHMLSEMLDRADGLDDFTTAARLFSAAQAEREV